MFCRQEHFLYSIRLSFNETIFGLLTAIEFPPYFSDYSRKGLFFVPIAFAK